MGIVFIDKRIALRCVRFYTVMTMVKKQNKNCKFDKMRIVFFINKRMILFTVMGGLEKSVSVTNRSKSALYSGRSRSVVTKSNIK